MDQKQVTFAPVPLDNQLWTAQDVADYMKISLYTAQNKVIIKPGFPCPVIPATASKRWVGKEVADWVKKQRA